ncbi:MAG: M20 aminoacylase family protein [Pseudoxanthomonas sp.]
MNAALKPRAETRNPSPGVLQPIAEHVHEAIALRHTLHQHPELAFAEHRTSALIASRLSGWGYDVDTGIASTGVVATLKRGNGTRKLGLRADIDALPITEASGLPYASAAHGTMHACGHDGHTAILLAAARYLIHHGQFDGTLQLFFQPAEETGSGAKRMLDEGLLERFPVDAIFGLHNWPGVPAGKFGFVEGPAMASVDWAKVTVRGKGGHGAEPHTGVDPVLVSAHLITALQSVVSRNVDPREMAVVTVGSIHGGNAANVIPDEVELKLTIRAFSPAVREVLRQRITTLAESVAASFGARVDLEFPVGFPSVINDPTQTRFAREVARELFGEDAIEEGLPPRTASEDFAFFLQQRPGAFIFVGNGDSASLHNPQYVFNDEVIPVAASYWARLAERFLVEDA